MYGMKQKTFRIEIQWDSEAEVFIAHSDDIYGLNTEAKTMPKLIQKVLMIAPELLELNGFEEDITEDNFLFDPSSFIVPYKEAAFG